MRSVDNSTLNNEELLEICRQRHENQEARAARGKANAKPKAKAKITDSTLSILMWVESCDVPLSH